MRSPAILARAAALLALALALGPGGVDALFKRAPAHDQTWPADGDEHPVRVCFRPPGTSGTIPHAEGPPESYTIDYTEEEWLEKRQMVRDAIESSWGRWTRLRFLDWGECPEDTAGFLYVDLIKADCNGCGNSFPWGYQTAGTWLWMKTESGNERLLRTVTMHEFGHALAFHHEMDRPDARYPDGTEFCLDKPGLYEEGVALTPYDDFSVMNYCAPRARNGLSHWDIEGALQVYGASVEAGWLKALPSLSLFAY